jgi:TetR/AcrR family transcriptional regulator, ethionamide resistance regulator
MPRGVARLEQRLRRQEVAARIVSSTKALLAERAWSDVAVDDVMAAAGASRTTFYRHFDDRQALLLTLLGELHDDMGAHGAAWAADDRDPMISTREHLQRLVDVFVANAPVLRALSEAASSEPDVDTAYQEMANGFITATATRVEREVRRGVSHVADPTETARALVWLTERYLTQTVARRHANPSVELIATTLSDIWIKAIWDHPPHPAGDARKADQRRSRST